MKKYVKVKDKYTCSESEFVNGKWKTRYFYFYCDICGVRHPDVCVNDLCEEEGFPEGDYCWNCQMSMRAQGFVGKDKSIYFYVKDRKCKQCKKPIRDLKKVVKLYYFFEKPVYFCNSNCYIKFVKKHHPTTKKEWDKKFNKLSEKQKKVYLSRLRKTKQLVKMLMKEYGDNYHLKGIRHACIWERPKAD